jgi:ubiquinone/menaquinone biosynthesis C-methylase UbiE
MATHDTVFPVRSPPFTTGIWCRWISRLPRWWRKGGVAAPERILIIAAGTGVVTEALHRALPQARIVATDLNPPMLEEAARRVSDPEVSFQPADAQSLQFADASFDLVVCQFGVMFFPDKVRGNAQARRVLRDGGKYLLVIWDKVERNLATMTAGRAVAELIPGEASRFYERVPFRYHDKARIAATSRRPVSRRSNSKPSH